MFKDKNLRFVLVIFTVTICLFVAGMIYHEYFSRNNVDVVKIETTRADSVSVIMNTTANNIKLEGDVLADGEIVIELSVGGELTLRRRFKAIHGHKFVRSDVVKLGNIVLSEYMTVPHTEVFDNGTFTFHN